MTLRIVIDGLRLEGQRLGVGRYLEYLLREWADAPEDDHYTVCVRRPLDDRAHFERGAVTVEDLWSRLPGYAWQTLRLGPAARAGGDVLFGPSYRLPWRYRGPAVVAVHSVNEVERGAHDLGYRLTHARIIRAGARAADRVIVPSRSTALDVERAYGVPAAKLVVIPQGADQAFAPHADLERDRAVRSRLLGDPDRPFVLWVGKLSQRRNIPMLIESFAAMRRAHGLDHHLLLFGPNHLELPVASIAAQFGVGDAVVQTDGVVADHRDVADVYRAADLYASASAYEGFSMTAVEALACGLPVVGVDRAGVAEIASGCALLVPEPSVDALADAMYRGLTDEALRADLRAKGLRRAEDFRWDDIARRTRQVLADAVRERSP